MSQHLAKLTDKINTFASRALDYAPHCTNESQTKTTLIEPYLEIIGYDVRNPQICQLEYTADIAKTGERVDYAILKDGQPTILIEAKSADSVTRGQAPPTQLQRYFVSTPANLGVFTDGLTWNWYRANPTHPKLEETPFLSYDVRHPGDIEIAWLLHINPTSDPTDEQANIPSDEDTNSRGDEQEAAPPSTAKVIFTGSFSGYLPKVLIPLGLLIVAGLFATGGDSAVAVIATPPLMLYWSWTMVRYVLSHLEITSDHDPRQTPSNSILRSYTERSLESATIPHTATPNNKRG